MAVEFVRLHCLKPDATYEDAIAFCVAYTAVTLQTMIERQEREGVPAKLH